MPRKLKTAILPIDYVQQRIFILRGQRVILAADLARMYGVPVKRLNEQVRRNTDRFPDDFVFPLTKDEADALSRSHFATLNDSPNLKSQIATSSWGGARRALPYAFTEHGVLMAANVLRSTRAAKVSVFIVRAFIKLRELLSTHVQLAEKLAELERKLQDHDGQILSIIDAIRELMDEGGDGGDDDPPNPPIGFQTEIAPRSPAKAKRK